MTCTTCIFFKKGKVSYLPNECMHYKWRTIIQNTSRPICSGSEWKVNHSILVDAIDEFPTHHKDGIKDI